MVTKSNRAKLVRSVRRCLADLVGAHVWKWNIERLGMECSYVWKMRHGELATDERDAVAELASEYEWNERRSMERNT